MSPSMRGVFARFGCATRRGVYGPIGLGKCDSGFEYCCTSKGFDADGALGIDDESCAHPAGTIRAATSIAAAGRIARNTLKAELERCIRFISIKSGLQNREVASPSSALHPVVT